MPAQAGAGADCRQRVQGFGVPCACSAGSVQREVVPVVAVLLAAGIPIEGLPLLFALDRLFDMIRTALNITGDAACAIIVDRYSPDYDPNRWSKEA